MNIELAPELIKQLEQLAQAENRDVDSVLSDAVKQYLDKKRERLEARDKKIDRILKEHEWLINELAKR